MGMLKIARSGFYRFAAVKRANSLFAAGALLCRGIAACSQALRSFALQANTQFSTLRLYDPSYITMPRSFLQYLPAYFF
jgi:hypothetical protein